MKDIGEKIRQARVLKNLSQKDLGELVRIDKQIIYKIENGKRTVTADELKLIAIVTDKPLDFFYEEELKINVATNHSKPTIDLTSLTDTQRKIISDLAEEFNKENKTDK